MFILMFFFVLFKPAQDSSLPFVENTSGLIFQLYKFAFLLWKSLCVTEHRSEIIIKVSQMCLEVWFCYKKKTTGCASDDMNKLFWNSRHDNVEILHFLFLTSIIAISGYCPHCLFKSFRFNPQRNTRGTQRR